MGIRSCHGIYISILQDNGQKSKTEIHHRPLPSPEGKALLHPIVGVGVPDDPCSTHRRFCNSRANSHRTQRRGRRPRRPSAGCLPEPGAMWASRPTGCGASQSIRQNEKREANSTHVSVMLRFTVGRPPVGRREQAMKRRGTGPRPTFSVGEKKGRASPSLTFAFPPAYPCPCGTAENTRRQRPARRTRR